MEDDEESIRPAEAARDRRRDRRSEAAERSGMRTGLAKQFKQVLDAQTRRAAQAERELEERDEESGTGRSREKDDRRHPRSRD